MCRQFSLGLFALTLACRSAGQGAEAVPPAPDSAVAPAKTEPSIVDDPHSFATPHEVQVRHVGLDLKVDFDDRVLEGEATMVLQRHDATAPLRLDTRGLEVTQVWAGQLPEASKTEEPMAVAELGDEANWQPASHELGETDPVLGRTLEIVLPPDADLVRVAYRTDTHATGLQWLEPGQTADQTQPFLYSQSQAIHARSWIPSQDTPGVRVTYDAVIEVPPPLTALMAAERGPSQPEQGRFTFQMPQPVPAYLIALAVGKLEFAELGPRSGVWAEPSILAKAAHEFADVEAMMKTAESLYGPYRWGRYDLLVLPPAFPFGGMENPRLTFATPTILAGDRSLVALVAHELAHSWSGNLVTNATWNHIWLNEGFTVYIERRIVEALFGPQRADMEAMLGRQDLQAELGELSEPDQRLVVDLQGRDPDDGLNNVPYEKGALFLRMLEETYGRERFDAFLRRWFDEHAFESVTTEQFVAFLQRELISQAQPQQGRDRPDLHAWLHGPGIGPSAPVVQTDAFSRVDEELERFASGKPASELAVQDWTPHQWLRFLRGLPKEMEPGRLAALDKAHGLTTSGNYEIAAQWLEVAVRRGYRAVDRRLEAFLLQVGRRKFLMPLYRSLLESDRAEDARRIYAQARDGYHPISQQSLDELLGG